MIINYRNNVSSSIIIITPLQTATYCIQRHETTIMKNSNIFLFFFTKTKANTLKGNQCNKVELILGRLGFWQNGQTAGPVQQYRQTEI